MQMKWIAVIMAWTAAGGAVTACAFAWGADGRWTVLILGCLVFIVVGIVTGSVSNTDTYEGNGETARRDTDG